MYPRLSSLQVTDWGCFYFFQVSSIFPDLELIIDRRNLHPRSRLMFIPTPISYVPTQSASVLELVFLNNNRWILQFVRESFSDHRRVPRIIRGTNVDPVHVNFCGLSGRRFLAPRLSMIFR